MSSTKWVNSLAVAIALLCFISTHGQVVVNEVSAKNLSSFADNEGDYPDWVELFNAGGSAVSLNGYHLSDNPLYPSKWALPNYSLNAGEYLTIFASGKDRFDFVDHWETAVYEDDMWRYLVATSTVDPTWRDTSFSDAGWTLAQGPVGYGDGDDNEEIADPSTSVFLRRTFTVADTTKVTGMILDMDYDDGFVAYLNGVEIARSNMSENFPAHDDLANDLREATMITGGDPERFIIAREVFSSALIQGANVLAVQVHNENDLSSDISSRTWLSVGINDAGSYYGPTPAWFTAPAGEAYFHANFKLDGGGDSLLLSDNLNALIESMELPKVSPDITWGRFPNGTGAFGLLDPASPDSSNGDATVYQGFWGDTVAFSHPAGFYGAAGFSLSLTAGDVQSSVYYTLDGSKPTSASTPYTGALNVDDNMVIRACAHRSGYISTEIETNTYILGNSENPDLPVFFISFKPDDFFDYNTGIYEEGPNASSSPPSFGANFWEDWEREIHIEYFASDDQQKLEQDCGVKIFGGWSRDNDMKSLRLIARDEEYGDKDFDYPFFPAKNHDDYRQLVLRNGGNDFNYAHMRDGLNHTALGQNTNHDYMSFVPHVVFLNGEYWGVHNLRERMNHQYVEDNHGIDDDDIDLMEQAGVGDYGPKKGSATEWNNLMTAAGQDLSNPLNYQIVKGMLDIENFADWWISQSFHVNWDTPHNNLRAWREQGVGHKWRYLYYDTDFGLNLFGASYTAQTYNELDRMISDTRSDHSELLRAVLANDEFKCYFINRYADLLNTIYKSGTYSAQVDYLESIIEDEMPNHFNKWTGGNMFSWANQVGEVRDFAVEREGYARDDVEDQFNLAGQVDLTINVSPVGAGVIKISTIIPDNLPWTGTYFNGCPVQLQAFPNQGYSFDNWTSSVAIGSPNSNSSISINFTTNDDITANFSEVTNFGELTISEINYNSGVLDSKDWIEFHNHGTAALDLSGYRLTDANDFNEYVFPNGYTLAAGGYVVVARDLAAFIFAHPTVTNVIGPLGYKFSNDGERLRVYDQIDDLVIDMTYSDVAPWPTQADGFGPTLELLDPDGDLSNASNWFAGCNGGSPGGPFVECPCADVDLGVPTLNLCAEGGNVTLTAQTAYGENNYTFSWYINDVLVVEPSNSYNVAGVGTYRVDVDSAGCVRTDQVVVSDGITLNLGPDIDLCDPPTAELVAQVNLSGLTYSWTKDASPIAGEMDSTLVVNQPGDYEVTATIGSCTPVTDQLTVTAQSATPTNAVGCGPGQYNLSVTGPGDYTWYDAAGGGNEVGSGGSFTTPNINTTTTYYVEDSEAFSTYVGPEDTLIGNAWSHDAFDDYKVTFNVQTDLTIESVKVFPRSDQDVTIRILSSDLSTVLHTVTQSVSAGNARIVLDAALSPGSYVMDAEGTTGRLYMNSENNAFPYEIQDTLSISGQIPSWSVGLGWYFFFYDWHLTNGSAGATCARIPVVAEIKEDPVANFTVSNVNPCVGEQVIYTSTSTGAYDDYLWNFGIDASMATATGPGPHAVNYSSMGSKNSVLTLDGACGQVQEIKQGVLQVSGNVTPAITISHDGILCEGDVGVFTGSHSGGGSNPTFQWKVGGTNVNGATSSIYSHTNGSLSEQVSVEFSSSSNCVVGSPTVTESFQLTPFAKPDPGTIAGETNVDCSVMYTYNVTGTAGSTYDWTLPGAAIISGPDDGSTVNVWFSEISGDITVQETSADGCVSDLVTKSVTIVQTQGCTVGLEKELTGLIDVYPNPFNESLQVDLPDELEGSMVKVFDAHGRKLWQARWASGQTINVDERWPSGVLTLEVTAGEVVSRQAIVRLP